MCSYKQCARVRATLTQRWYLQLTLHTGLGKSKYCTVSLFCSEDTQTNVSVAIVATCGGGEAAKYQPSHPATHFSRWNTLSGGFCCCWLSETQPQPGHQCSLWQPRASLNWICIYISTIVGYTPHSTLQTGTRQLCSQHHNNIPQHADCRSEQAADWRLPIANKQ